MRLIDADALKKTLEETKDEYFGLYQAIKEIDNAPTIEGFVCEDEYGMVGIEYKEVVIERTFKDADGETCQVLRICEEDQNGRKKE